MSRLIPSGEVALSLGIKTQTLAKWRCEHRGPQGWIHLSATRCVYPEESVEAFIRQLSEQKPEFNLPSPSRPKIVAGVME
jgi:transposase-like protein